MPKSKKAKAPVIYRHLEVLVSGNKREIETIEITDDPQVVLNTFNELFKRYVSDLFGADQAEAFKQDMLKNITKALASNLQAGFSTFHRMTLTNDCEWMPYVSVVKAE